MIKKVFVDCIILLWNIGPEVVLYIEGAWKGDQ